MSQLIILAGIPGCGKTTWAETFPILPIVSSDEIRSRSEFGGDVNNQENNEAVFAQFHLEIRDHLRMRQGVVADATNLTARARAELLADANEVTAKTDQKIEIHLVIFTNIAAAFRQNAKRERVVPEYAMLRMLDNYEKTLLALPTERSYYNTVTKIEAFS